MSMGITATLSLFSTSPYSQSRMHDTPEMAKESKADYERRTWREKSHYDSDGILFIPRMAFKFCIQDAASYLGERIKGKGTKTWTSYFTSAVIVNSDLSLGIHKDRVGEVTINAHPGGNRKGQGSNKRVRRTFPVINSWAGEVEVLILDETITEDIFRRVIEHAGQFIGIGRFRPCNGGTNGRFAVKSVGWKKGIR